MLQQAPQRHWKTITFVGALRRHGVTALRTVDGAMAAKRFSAYVERWLAATFKRKVIVMVDNLSAHAAAVREAIEARRGHYAIC